MFFIPIPFPLYTAPHPQPYEREREQEKERERESKRKRKTERESERRQNEGHVEGFIGAPTTRHESLEKREPQERFDCKFTRKTKKRVGLL